MTVSLMDHLHIILPFLWGAVSCSFDWTSASVTEVTVRHGDNITLYCDCRMGDGGLTVWFRNCSHENQPVLVLDRNYFFQNLGKTQFRWTKNNFSDSYDLTIINVTYSDEGFYYCATEGMKVEDKDKIGQRRWFNYSNIIKKISINSNGPCHSTSNSHQNDEVCWKLLFSVCPVVSLLSALLSVLVYRICQKSGFLQTPAAKSSQNFEKNQNSRDRMRRSQRQESGTNSPSGFQSTVDEDVCYAALEIQHSSLKAKRKRKTQASDFSTYSAIKTSHL